jgi:hypothetical protein
MTNYPANAEMRTREQVRLLTRHFYDLQGLRQVPFGVLLLILFGLAAWLPATPQVFPQHGSGYVRLLLVAGVAIGFGFVLALLAMRLISTRYLRRFGSVEPSRQHLLWVFLIGWIGSMVILVPINLDKNLWLASGTAMPVNVADFMVAAGLLLYWWYLGRSLHHYLVLAGIGIALGVASALGLTPATWPWHVREALLLFGGATIVGGTLDHRVLVRALTQRPTNAQ